MSAFITLAHPLSFLFRRGEGRATSRAPRLRFMTAFQPCHGADARFLAAALAGRASPRSGAPPPSRPATTMFPTSADVPALLPRVVEVISQRAQQLQDLPTLPTPDAIETALACLVTELPPRGLGTEAALENVMEASKGLAMGHAGPRVS